MTWFSRTQAFFGFRKRQGSSDTATVQVVTNDMIDSMPSVQREIARFWFNVRGDDIVPNWNHFSPKTHAQFLPHILFWEIVDQSYLARITGEAIKQQLPVNLAGRSLPDIDGDELNFLPAELDHAVANNGPVYVDRANAWRVEDETVRYRAIHLPFRADAEETNRVLSVMSFTSEPLIEV